MKRRHYLVLFCSLMVTFLVIWIVRRREALHILDEEERATGVQFFWTIPYDYPSPWMRYLPNARLTGMAVEQYAFFQSHSPRLGWALQTLGPLESLKLKSGLPVQVKPLLANIGPQAIREMTLIDVGLEGDIGPTLRPFTQLRKLVLHYRHYLYTGADFPPLPTIEELELDAPFNDAGVAAVLRSPRLRRAAIRSHVSPAGLMFLPEWRQSALTELSIRGAFSEEYCEGIRQIVGTACPDLQFTVEGFSRY
jgi:hypothetical protein